MDENAQNDLSCASKDGDFDMTQLVWNNVISKATIVALSFLLAACHLEKPQVTSTPLQKTHSKAADAAKKAEVETPSTPPSLEFEWDTGFSNVISPPADIRKAALASCKARDYDQSYMISMALSSGVVKAMFGCRGPN